VITGHNSLGYFRNIVDPENNDPFCRFCNDNRYETFIHLIQECERFEQDARNIFFDQPPFQEQTWKPEDILAFAELPDIAKALQGIYEDETYESPLNN
jgi:hypothetical protein